MSVDVRPIADAELSGWVDTMRTAFHLPPGVEAASPSGATCCSKT